MPWAVVRRDRSFLPRDRLRGKEMITFFTTLVSTVNWLVSPRLSFGRAINA